MPAGARLTSRDSGGPIVGARALGLLPGGRVALRDRTLADRITVYAREGSVDTTWFLGERQVSFGSARPMVVDTSGLLWISIGSLPTTPVIGFSRLRDGAIIDTVRLPPLPEFPRDEVRIEKHLPSGGLAVKAASTPYQPSAVWALDRRRRFAIAGADKYRIEILPPHGTAHGSASSIVSRQVRIVPVTEDQRAYERDRLIKIMSKMGMPIQRLPDVPRVKPPIKRLAFSSDDQLLVQVSVPSRLVDGTWVEPIVYDVFDRNDKFRGRLSMPDQFSMAVLKGDKLWGVWRDENGVESIGSTRSAGPGDIHSRQLCHEQVPKAFENVASGHVANPARGKIATQDAENLLPYGRRNPREDIMAWYVVERSQPSSTSPMSVCRKIDVRETLRTKTDRLDDM